MAIGTFGGRFPVGNRVMSNLIVAASYWRQSSRKVRHAVKRRPIEAVETNPGAAAELQEFLQQGYTRINLGGGSKNLDGFVNVDFLRHEGVKRQIVANVLDLSFIPDGSVTQVHSNHVIEHITKEEIAGLLKSCWRILRPDGLLTIRCPNALGAAYGFWFEPVLEKGRDAFLEAGFPAEEDFRNAADRWVFRDFYGVLHWFFGDPGSVSNEHRTLVTPTLLRALVEEAGFSVARMTEPEALNLVLVARKVGAD